ncbi:MAG TPA: EF-hand domain-containing protein [Nitrospira sp.]|nr:EF-hand domain-containing protein [Nitrospira sp.]
MSILTRHVLILFCATLWYGSFDPVSLAKEKSKEPSSVLDVRKTSKMPAERSERSSGPAVKKAGRQSQPGRPPRPVHAQGRQNTAEPPAQHRMSHHPMSKSKKVLPKATLGSDLDPKPHGMLQDSRRYDSRLGFRTSGLQDPQLQHVSYEHFQELDRNQDGRIDPVERAFSRLDMDRDLHDHRR